MPRRPASPVTIVVLAAAGALLAGAAGTGAYLGVSNYLQNRPTTAGPGGDPSSPGPTTTDEGPEGVPCPQHTIARVKEAGRPGELVIDFYVRGKRLNGPRKGLGGEAWICRDSDGTLYYQGHDIDGGPLDADTDSQTGNLFFVGGGGQYGEVTFDGTTYRIVLGNGERDLNTTADDFGSTGQNGLRWSIEVRQDDTGPSEFTDVPTG